MYAINFFDERQAVTAFADRVPQSEAIAASLAFHAERAGGDLPRLRDRRNVLVFYGMGGIGKTTLSARLESWINGTLRDPGDWGAPPVTDNLVTGRWELNNSQGNLSAQRLLIALRDTMGKSRRSWPAFDTAFAAYFSSIRPGEPLPEMAGSRNPVESGIVGLAQDAFQDLKDFGTDLDLDYTNLVGGVGGGLLKSAMKVLKVAVRRHKAFQHASPQLEALLEVCSRDPSPENEMPHLVPSIMSMLTLDMNAIPSSARPVPVIFVDHFEKIQTPGRRLGEELLNACIQALPGVLFVVSGRNRMDWDSPGRHDLPIAGRAAWPGLILGVEQDPRQHLIGSLSDDDTRSAVLQRAAIEDIDLAPEIVEAVVAATKGWPIHMDAVATYIRNVAAEGRPIRVEDVQGDLSRVVERLVEDLPADETKALQACCLLPFFDEALAAAVGNVDEGAVARFTARALILKTFGETYPFRVHDSVRDAVKVAGPNASGGWAPADWVAAARRGVAHAEQRFEAAKAEGDDRGMVRAIGLAVRICHDYEIWEDWLAKAVPHVPSFAMAADIMPANAETCAEANVHDVLMYIEAKSLGAEDRAVEILREVAGRGAAMSWSAGLWVAYKLRAQGKFDEALPEFAALRVKHPERAVLLDSQTVSTLVMARKFRTAHELILTRESTARGVSYINQQLGDFSHFLASTPTRIAAGAGTMTRLFTLELESRMIRARSLTREVSEPEVEAMLHRMESVGYKGGHRNLLSAMGYFHVADTDTVHKIVEQMRGLRSSEESISVGEAELLLLNALATDDAETTASVHLEYADLPQPGAGWIRVEILMEALGLDVRTPDTQWLAPYETVRDRWLGHYNGLIALGSAAGAGRSPAGQ